jgi:hypothetical protein
MNYTLFVRRRKRIRELKPRIGELLHTEAACRKLVAECPAGHQFVHNETFIRRLDEIKHDGDT